ncbi:DUF2333 family protein [Candidatus Thiothrix sp. Deng01]|uniref:DUF2333 family protein n=1 Tax=Candidatus Thiothrix phosphatis TaxID=3112415 RepID=A0ABU6CUC9_9GAMM|nr:DUF2333 family protein [Candidatus Thiothrix sp. Deng01]MEB4590369.1 DUF2333 family protein [Candidatus Thiothrix sp. Deng01]
MPILSASASGSKKVLGFYHPKTWKEKGLWWTLGLFLITYLIVVLVLGLYWSNEPDTFDVNENAKLKAEETKTSVVPGFTTTATLIKVASTLLDKPGGYLSNDVTPPGVYLDNIPEWEFGVLVQTRDMARTFRNDFSRSQSQSTEDKDLIIAEPHFNFDSESWLFPPTETEYRTSIKALDRYLLRLSDPKQMNAQFYARADNLRDWLAQVEKRLGSLSQRLSASVGQENLNLGLAGDSAAQQSTPTPSQQYTKTPWTQIDNVFYEARGQSWALLHFLKAVQTDFAPVLDKKNARISLQQIIRELESTQQTIWSPMILNGNGFGFVTNHSLIMASYLSRANAAVIDLRRLLEQG